MTIDIDSQDLGTIIAGVRCYQAYLTTGEWPTGERLKAIHDIAGDGCDCLTPEDMDGLCEILNLSRAEAE